MAPTRRYSYQRSFDLGSLSPRALVRLWFQGNGSHLPGRAGGCPTGPPTVPYVRDERIRFLGYRSLGTTPAHHCATRHDRSDGVDDLGGGQNIGLQQPLEFLPVNRTFAAATTQPVAPCPLHMATDFVEQPEVPSNPIVLEMPAQFQAEHPVLVFEGCMSIRSAPPPQRLLRAAEQLPGRPAFDHPVTPT